MFGSVAWATSTSCGGTITTAGEITNYQGANNCTSTDKLFDNFSLTGSAVTGTTPPTASSLTNVFFFAGGSFTPSSITSPTSDAGDVDTSLTGTNNAGTTNIWSLGGPGDQTSDVTIAYTAAVNPAVAAGSPSLSFVIDGIQLDPSGSATWTDGDTAGTTSIERIVITETFCIGASTTTGCAAADTGTIVATLNATGTSGSDTTFTFTCAAGGAIACGSATSSTATFGNVSTVATSEVIDITRDMGIGATVDLSTTGNNFQEGAISSTPEPSTLILCGAALLGLGAFGYRRRRRA